jgi:hypothetical protein
MTIMGLSRSPILPYVSSLFGGIFVFFGLTYIRNSPLTSCLHTSH